MKRKKKEKVTFQREGMIRKEKGRGERCNETRREDAKKEMTEGTIQRKIKTRKGTI